MIPLLRQNLSLFFSPPVFPDDEEKMRTAQILNTLQNIYLIMLLLSGSLIIPFVVVKKTAVGFFAFILLTVLIGSRYLMVIGKVRLACRSLLITFWVTITVISIMGDGLKDMILVFLLATTVMGGLLLGQRFVSGMILSSVSFAFILLLFENQGVLPFHYFPKPPLVKWLELAFSLVITGIVLSMALRSRENALTLARVQLKERQSTGERDFLP
jgi:hypothetical protein